MGAFEWLFLSGRILFSLIFITSGFSHFRQVDAMGQYADAKGLPAPRFMVIVSGAMLLLGGVSILLWTAVEVGSWLLITFLLVAAFTFHDYWALEDPQQRQAEQAQFMKNIALAGAALVFYALTQEPGIAAEGAFTLDFFS